MWFLPEISDQNDRKCDYQLRVCELKFYVAALVWVQDVQVVWVPPLHMYQTQFTLPTITVPGRAHAQNTRMKSRDRLNRLVFPLLSLTITSLHHLTFHVNCVGQPPPPQPGQVLTLHQRTCSQCSPSITGNWKRVTQPVQLSPFPPHSKERKVLRKFNILPSKIILLFYISYMPIC